MFHWLSQYNYDFALAAIPIQLLLLIFYCSRRNLPIRASRTSDYRSGSPGPAEGSGTGFHSSG